MSEGASHTGVGTAEGDIRPASTVFAGAVSQRGLQWIAMAVLALALPLAAVVIRGTFDWLREPFPGFLVMGNRVVPTVGFPSWTGMRAGVPFHARVVSVDGKPVRSSADVYGHVASLPVGREVRYGLERGDTTTERVVSTMHFGVVDYLLSVGLYALFGIASIVIGVAVFLLKPQHVSARAFVSLGTTAGLFSLTAPTLYHPAQWWLSPLHFVAQAAYPAALMHLAVTFPVPRRFVERQPLWLVLPYAVSLLLAAGILQGFYASPPGTTALYAAFAYSGLATIVLLGVLSYSFWERRSEHVRLQLRMVLPIAFLATIVIVGRLVVIAMSRQPVPINALAVPPALFYLAVAYAIYRYDLFDIDVVVRRTVAYVMLTVIITAVYVGSVVMLGYVLPQWTANASPVFNLTFVVLVAFLFEPGRSRVQRFVDRRFFRAPLDFRRVVGDLSAALTTLLDLEQILQRVGVTLSERLHLRPATVVLWQDAEARVWRYRKADGQMTATGGETAALQRALCRNLRPLWLQRSAAPDRDGGTLGDDALVRAEMVALDAALVFPMVLRDHCFGALAVGAKRSGWSFSQEDVELLQTLAAQSAVAIANALSYQELQALNESLDRKVAARTSELQAANEHLALAYEELKSAQAKLLHSEKLASLGQLVAGVAHEINNPLSFITGNVVPIQRILARVRGQLEGNSGAVISDIDRVTRIIELMARGAERTANIVSDLRSFSRVDVAPPEPVDVHERIEFTIRLLQPRWRDRVAVHRDYAVLPKVDAAPGQLDQVFMNLISNACDAIDTTGNVWIRTRADGSRVIVAVRDDGRGIPRGLLPRIFDPFFTTKSQGQGTGLGLAISHGIVTHHGGTIDVTSEPGRGTEFRLTLPMHH